MSLIIVEAIPPGTMCEFHESTCNGFGDIWWTDNPIYFSSIDGSIDVMDSVTIWFF